MLEIKDIIKIYKLKDAEVTALNGVSVNFRKSEFVSILGPSGCGKTTLLNIIGGLDRYTDGDLIIDGVSTKKYSDKDWDNYRNHKVGFIFQSYNLIPHQTVLENVELALTLSGISKKERKNRAKKVLEQVGLGDKLKNKPNQLSGGQMQRVAIARALVNDPDIILADEPTGALDSKTSVQIMDLLKKVSRNKLVIMVTHNPDLAKEYSSRIVRLFDGELKEDTKPYETSYLNRDVKRLIDKQEDDNKEQKEDEEQFKKTTKKKSMSFFTALSLSFKNLLTKKARTILVAFAGSIGIIGIALILSLSSGFQTYINKVEADTLTNYPIEISEKATDTNALLASMFVSPNNGDADHNLDAVYSNDLMLNLMSTIAKQLKTNDMKGFYEYLQKEENYNKIKDYVSAIKYSYDLSKTIILTDGTAVEPNSPALTNIISIYSVSYVEFKGKVTVTFDGNDYLITKNADFDATSEQFLRDYLSSYAETIISSGTTTIPASQFGLLISAAVQIPYESYIAMLSSSSTGESYLSYTNEMIENMDLIKSQYDLVYGNWNTEYNEVVLTLDSNNEMSDYLLYALGFIDDEQFKTASKQSFLENSTYKTKINYENVIGKEYKVNIKSDYFKLDLNDDWVDVRTLDDAKNENYGKFVETFGKTREQIYEEIKNSATTIKISGVVRLNDQTQNGALSDGLNYNRKLTEYLINKYNDSNVVKDTTRASSLNNAKIFMDTPKSIKIYIKDFDSRDKIIEFIEDYNKNAEAGKQISYSNTVGMMMESINTIINAITYVLVGFVSVSLVVSSIMIGIITYISVIERTKEIGVLRSIGASKRDIKRVFTAESFIIGLTSGIMGILISLLLIIPINIILKSVTGIAGLAYLPVLGAVCLIIISFVLTFIAGLIPARIAAKKDPVLALRSE